MTQMGFNTERYCNIDIDSKNVLGMRLWRDVSRDCLLCSIYQGNYNRRNVVEKPGDC